MQACVCIPKPIHASVHAYRILLTYLENYQTDVQQTYSADAFWNSLASTGQSSRSQWNKMCCVQHFEGDAYSTACLTSSSECRLSPQCPNAQSPLISHLVQLLSTRGPKHTPVYCQPFFTIFGRSTLQKILTRLCIDSPPHTICLQYLVDTVHPCPCLLLIHTGWPKLKYPAVNLRYLGKGLKFYNKFYHNYCQLINE